jgi:AAA+ ATPase superfamily predicted ATPase
MIERTIYLKRLIQLKDQNLIKVITGIRRCGKSTLLEAFKNELLTNLNNYYDFVGLEYDEEYLRQRLEINLLEKNAMIKDLSDFEGYSVEEVLKEYKEYAEQLEQFVCDTTLLLNNALKEKRHLTSLCFQENYNQVHYNIPFQVCPFFQ